MLSDGNDCRQRRLSSYFSTPSGLEGILPKLFKEVVIPEAVERELRRAHPVLPSFIRTIAINDRQLVDRLCRDLDQGEAEAIALILERRGDLLLIDKRKGSSAGACHLFDIGAILQAWL